jgi:carbonic anhydrase
VYVSIFEIFFSSARRCFTGPPTALTHIYTHPPTTYSTWEIEFVDCEEEFTVTVDGEEWKLYQMHVHGPSEHAVNGMYYPLEAHLVHLPKEGSATRGLVLGLFLTPGKSNSILSIFDNEDADFVGEAFKAFNPYQLLPQDKSYVHYT